MLLTKDRIKLVRKNANLTQTAFGERIGVKGNTVTGWETGLRAPSEAIITSICREFDVREEWLRTGKLPMRQPISRNTAIKEFVDDAMAAESSDFRQRLLAVLAKLDIKEWELLEAMALKLAAEATAQRPNILKIAGRDGSYQEHAMTDDETEVLKDRLNDLPGPPDDL